MKKKSSLFRGVLLLLACFCMIGKSAVVEAKDTEVSLERGEEVFYDGYSTFYYYIDGKLGYCLEPTKSSPHDGKFTADKLSHDTLLSKSLYYMYGGPGYEKHMKPSLDGKYKEKKMAYCLSHCVLSYVYDNCNGNSDAFKGISEEMKAQVLACVKDIKKFPGIPEPELEFSESYTKAYFSQEEKVQRTKEIICSGDTGNYVELSLPEGVTLVNITRETSNTGKVKVYGEDHFYLCADAGKFNGESWESGAVYGVNQQRWRSLVISTGKEGQHLGSGSLVTAETSPVSLGVEWIPFPELTVDKKADREDKKYKVGDLITYSIDVTQQIEKAVAKNVIITDTILTEGVTLQENSIVLLDQNQSIVSDAVISVDGNSYTIHAGEFLQGIETGEKYLVQYQVEITDEALIGKEIENEVIVRADNAEDVEDDEKVIVEKPEEPEEKEVPPVEPKPKKPEVKPVVKPVEKIEPVKTGDEQNVGILSVIMLLSCVGILVCGKMAHKIK